MENNKYYKYHEILFSLRKEYLKNQEIINKLLSYIEIADNTHNEYKASLIFRSYDKNKIDHILLIISKRQSNIRLIIKSIYDSIVSNDPIVENGKYLYVFRLSENFVSLLDANQDGRYLNSKITITNPEDFIESYKLLNESLICKKGNTNLNYEKTLLKISNNGLHLLHVTRSDHKKNISIDYDGIEDYLITNNNSYMKNIMELKFKKDTIPPYFRNLIDTNMDDYSFSIEEQKKKKKGIYKIEEHDRTLILKPYNHNRT